VAELKALATVAGDTIADWHMQILSDREDEAGGDSWDALQARILDALKRPASPREPPAGVRPSTERDVTAAATYYSKKAEVAREALPLHGVSCPNPSLAHLAHRDAVTSRSVITLNVGVSRGKRAPMGTVTSNHRSCDEVTDVDGVARVVDRDQLTEDTSRGEGEHPGPLLGDARRRVVASRSELHPTGSPLSRERSICGRRSRLR
jgi:hypothetical protein